MTAVRNSRVLNELRENFIIEDPRHTNDGEGKLDVYRSTMSIAFQCLEPLGNFSKPRTYIPVLPLGHAMNWW